MLSLSLTLSIIMAVIRFSIRFFIYSTCCAFIFILPFAKSAEEDLKTASFSLSLGAKRVFEPDEETESDTGFHSKKRKLRHNGNNGLFNNLTCHAQAAPVSDQQPLLADRKRHSHDNVTLLPMPKKLRLKPEAEEPVAQPDNQLALYRPLIPSPRVGYLETFGVEDFLQRLFIRNNFTLSLPTQRPQALGPITVFLIPRNMEASQQVYFLTVGNGQNKIENLSEYLCEHGSLWLTIIKSITSEIENSLPENTPVRSTYQLQFEQGILLIALHLSSQTSQHERLEHIRELKYLQSQLMGRSLTDSSMQEEQPMDES